VHEETSRFCIKRNARALKLLTQARTDSGRGALTPDELGTIRMALWATMDEAVEDVHRMYEIAYCDTSLRTTTHANEKELAFA